MATSDEVRVFLRVVNVYAHCSVPAIGYWCKMRVDGRPEASDDVGQRVAEILVLPAPEPVLRHHHPAAEDAVFQSTAGPIRRTRPGNKTFDYRTTLGIKVLRNAFPLNRLHPLAMSFAEVIADSLSMRVLMCLPLSF